MSKIKGKPVYLHIAMPDRTTWSVPVEIIARSRAAHYASEFDDDIERSLAEDTLPLFASDNHAIVDWAASNMNWSDVVTHAVKVESRVFVCDYQEGWTNGEKTVIREKDEGTP